MAVSTEDLLRFALEEALEHLREMGNKFPATYQAHGLDIIETILDTAIDAKPEKLPKLESFAIMWVGINPDVEKLVLECEAKTARVGEDALRHIIACLTSRDAKHTYSKHKVAIAKFQDMMRGIDEDRELEIVEFVLRKNNRFQD